MKTLLWFWRVCLCWSRCNNGIVIDGMENVGKISCIFCFSGANMSNRPVNCSSYLKTIRDARQGTLKVWAYLCQPGAVAIDVPTRETSSSSSSSNCRWKFFFSYQGKTVWGKGKGRERCLVWAETECRHCRVDIYIYIYIQVRDCVIVSDVRSQLT
jgi:hypothetical protein